MTQFVEMPDGEYIPFDLYSRYKFITFFQKENFLSFEEAKEFVINLKIKNANGWQEYCKSNKKPDNIPAAPEKVYEDKGWISWGNFLGTGNVCKKDFISFKEARKFVRKLKLKNTNEWQNYCISGNKSDNIPSHPQQTYKKEWKGYGDFLGTGYISTHNRKFLSFEKAREFVRKLELKSETEWRKYCKSGKRPYNIPANLNAVYKDKWQGIGDFLGTGNASYKNRIFLSFKEVRKFVKKLKLNNVKEWLIYCKSGKRPNSIPSNPNKTYKDKGWISWGDFLGTGSVCKKYFISFEETRIFVKKLKLNNTKEWFEYCISGNKPDNIPSSPHQTYKREWISWYDFLGKKRKTA